jgi:hypothetical protein
LFYADNLIKAHGSIKVVKMWCGIRTDPVLKCFNKPEELSYGDLLVSVVPELSGWLMV